MNSNWTDTKEIRKFGVFASIIFGSLCLVGVFTKKPLPSYLFGVLFFLGTGFILIPARLRRLYSAWLTVAHFLGKISTAIILILAYYFVITPTGLIKRLFGGTPLPLKPDKNKLTYWVTREEPIQPKDRFLKRY